MSIDELLNSLLVHEQKLNRTSDMEQPTTLKTSTEFSSMRGKGRGRCGRGHRRGVRGRGHTDGKDGRAGNSSFQISKREDDPQGEGRKHHHKSHIECYRCGNYGYYKNECYTKLPKERAEKSIFVEKKEEETLLMDFHALDEPDQETWYVETGCSY